MAGTKFGSIDDYLAAQDPVKAKTLKAILDYVVDEFPGLEPKLAWNVPTIHRDGKYIVGLAAYTKHLTVSAWSPKIIEDFKERLGKYKVFKNCFQIPVDWAIDKPLVKALVKARLAELD